MRFFAVLLLLSPAWAPDSDRQKESVSPYLPIVLENPDGRPETIVGVLDTHRGRLVWNRTIRRNPFRIATLSAYGNAILLGIEESSGDAGVTVGLHLKSGEILFEHPGTVGATIVVNGRPSVVLGHPHGMTCFDAQTGRELWFWEGQGCGYIPTMGPRRLLGYLGNGSGGIAAVDEASGRELWRRRKGADETLVHGSTRLWSLKGDEVFEVDVASGKEGSRFKMPQPTVHAGTDGRLLFLLFPRFLQALDAETLRPVWRWESPSVTSTLFATSHGLLVSTGDGRIHLLDPESGRTVGSWDVPDGDSGYCVTQDRLFIHYSCRRGKPPLYRIIDARRGQILWRGEAENFFDTKGGEFGFAFCNDRIWHVDLGRQEIRWNTTLPGSISEAMIYSGRVLAVAGQEVVALNPSSGDRLWRWAPSVASKAVVLGCWRRPD